MVGYTIVLETEEEGGIVVSVPALPGCFSQGESRDEALQNAREAIAVYLDELRARGEELPREVRTETQFLEIPELEYGT
ncbi:MAG: type II toxin-antitoxin system HicB family antitoxin [Candidatus Eisenbacteria bacterium]|nr:type II toxin-antitoxin system HicB family antitoxin [Candidatus Eisenbacteria bacterium]